MISIRHARMSAATLIAVLGALSVAAHERPVEKDPIFKVKQWVDSVAFAPDGKTLACDLVLREVAAGKEVARGKVGEDVPACMHAAFSPDGRQMASVHFDDNRIDARHAICVWSVRANNELHPQKTLYLTKEHHPPYTESLYYSTFSPDGEMLATRHPGDTTIVWETATGNERLRLDTQGLAVAFAPDGRTLISVSRDGLVQHWDLATKARVHPKVAASRQDFLFVERAIASADGKILALTDRHTVVLKDACSGKTLRRFDNRGGECLALSADGRVLAVSREGGVFLYETKTGKEMARVRRAKRTVGALALSPDAKNLAVASDNTLASDQLVSLWEVGKLPDAHKGEVKRDSRSAPLEAKLTSRKDAYTLALGGKTPEEFGRLIKGGSLPPSPSVDLVLTLRNISDKKVAFDKVDIKCEEEFGLHLIGAGAMNHPVTPYQTGYIRPLDGQVEKPKPTILAPGETYSVPITSLDFGHDQQCYWLLPGEYLLHGNCWVYFAQDGEGAHRLGDESWSANLPIQPLRVKVVAERK